MNRIIEFGLFDFGCQLGILFFGKYSIRIHLPDGIRLNRKGALMRLLEFVAYGVNHAPQKEKAQFFLQFFQQDFSPIFDGGEPIFLIFHPLKKNEETQEKYQCPMGLDCPLNKSQKGECEPYKEERKPNS